MRFVYFCCYDSNQFAVELSGLANNLQINDVSEIVVMIGEDFYKADHFSKSRETLGLGIASIVHLELSLNE